MAEDSFEHLFLALAVKNKLITREGAVGALNEFNAQPESGGRSIGEILMGRGALSEQQAGALEAGAKKLLGGQKTQVVSPAPAPKKAAGPVNPKEPIPGYQIAGKLGTGGTATVFLALDARHGGRKVALKILHPSKAGDPKALESFLREAALLVEFKHPNLVQGYDKGRNGPLVYVAMECLEGESVQDLIDREKGIPEARSLEIILETAKALDYIQAQGIVHRDIKPGNIMLLKDGRVVLCDLGFALPMGGKIDAETTSGTVQYMSPEQAKGAVDIDARADIYSLGASLYHMVVGEVPFSGGDSVEVMAKQVLEALNSSQIKNRRISKHMHYFIERMMTKEKDLRYASPRELIDDINVQIDGIKSLEFKPERGSERGSKILGGLRDTKFTPRPVDGGGATRRLPPRPTRFGRPPKS